MFRRVLVLAAVTVLAVPVFAQTSQSGEGGSILPALKAQDTPPRPQLFRKKQAAAPTAAPTAAPSGSLYNMTPKVKAAAKPAKSATAKPSKPRPKAGGMKADAVVTTGPRPISSWPTGKKLVALTYDDGPNAEITPKLLKLLKEKNAKATFFLQGESILAYPKLSPELITSMATMGFELGNHTVTHKQLTRVSDDTIRRELSQCGDLITSASGGVHSRVMRPPYGSWNPRVRDICEQMGLKIIMWDVDTNDWQKRSTQQIIDTIMKETRDGSIILMHDRYQTSLDATAAVIDALGKQGYKFVTVSELMSQPRVETTRQSSPATSATQSR